MESGVAANIIRKFQNKNLILSHIAALSGFILGAKLCDLFFFDQSKYDAMREDMEDEFWLKYGEPKNIKPYIVNSQKQGQEHVKRKSWIYIMYEKDKVITKKEDMD